MEPSFRPGDVIWLDPNTHGKPGDDDLMIPADEEMDPRRCLCELVEEKADEWIVRQYNPAKLMTNEKSEWPTCLVIHHRERPQKAEAEGPDDEMTEIERAFAEGYALGRKHGWSGGMDALLAIIEVEGAVELSDGYYRLETEPESDNGDDPDDGERVPALAA